MEEPAPVPIPRNIKYNHIITNICAPGSLPSGTCSEDLPREMLGRHPYQITSVFKRIIFFYTSTPCLIVLQLCWGQFCTVFILFICMCFYCVILCAMLCYCPKEQFPRQRAGSQGNRDNQPQLGGQRRCNQIITSPHRQYRDDASEHAHATPSSSPRQQQTDTHATSRQRRAGLERDGRPRKR